MIKKIKEADFSLWPTCWRSGLLAFGLVLLLGGASNPAQAACTSPAGAAGKVIYNADVKVFQYCNDTNWIRMNQPGSGSGGCTSPTLAEGQVVFNTDYRVPQGCAGNVHRAFGPSKNESGWDVFSAGIWTPCGVKTNGTLWCWGADWTGQRGDGAASGNGSSPVQIGTDTWLTVDTWFEISCGIKRDGTAWCWGNDPGTGGASVTPSQAGMVGDGATSAVQTAPVAVAGGFTWKKISVGRGHVCGITGTDDAYCWGNDTSGQLGNGATAGTQVSPSLVSGGLSWADINAGVSLTCGITTAGAAYCWGLDASGQLGNGATAGTQTSPSLVSGGYTWKKIMADSDVGDYACGIQSDDTLWCWGNDANGRLGNGAGGSTTSPGIVSGGFTWKNFAIKSGTGWAIRSNDDLYGWGNNAGGAVGDGTITDRQTPVAVLGGYKWLSVSRNWGGITTDRIIRNWGAEDPGQFGDGEELLSTYRWKPKKVSGTWNAMTTGYDHACGIKSDGSAWCWGDDTSGQLGNGATTGDQSLPTAVTGGATWTMINAAYRTTCAIKSDATLWCWGDDTGGKVGDGGGAVDQTSPVQVGAATWKKVSVGNSVVCAVKSDDTLWCWGRDNFGQVGDGGGSVDQFSPVQVGAATWKDVGAGEDHACAVKSDDTLWCWGSDSDGQIGNGATAGNQYSPVQVGVATWKKVDSGFHYSCGIQSSDAPYCWGDNGGGKIGNGAWTDVDAPTAVSGALTLSAIAAGDFNTCGIALTGALYCWGVNDEGEMGDGTTSTAKNVPQVVPGAGSWVNIDLGAVFVCARGSSELYCWGYTGDGRLGIGFSDNNLPPNFMQVHCGAPEGEMGKFFYNSASNVVQYCDGASWIAIKN